MCKYIHIYSQLRTQESGIRFLGLFITTNSSRASGRVCYSTRICTSFSYAPSRSSMRIALDCSTCNRFLVSATRTLRTSGCSFLCGRAGARGFTTRKAFLVVSVEGVASMLRGVGCWIPSKTIFFKKRPIAQMQSNIIFAGFVIVYQSYGCGSGNAWDLETSNLQTKANVLNDLLRFELYHCALARRPRRDDTTHLHSMCRHIRVQW